MANLTPDAQARMQADIDTFRANKGLPAQPAPVAGGAPSAGPRNIQADLAAYRASKSGGTAPAPTPTGTAAPADNTSVIEKVGDFLAPTTTSTVKKLLTGHASDIGLKDVAGTALEIGSYLIPEVGLLKAGGLGLKGLKALSLAEKAGLGAKIGAASGAALGAGGALGKDDASVQSVLTDTLTGGAFGAAGGAAIPAGGALIAGTARKLAPAAEIVARGAKNLGRNTAEAIVNPLQEQATIRALPQSQRVLRNAGFDQRSTDFISKATPQTRQGFRDMLSIAEKGSQDARYRVQPKQVLGKAFLKRVDTIQRDSLKARNEITNIAKQPKTIDIRPALAAFNKRLEERGIGTEVVQTASGKPMVKYVSRGNIPSSETKYYKDILKEVELVTNGESQLSNAKAHALRQRLFATLEAEAKKGTQPGVRPFSDKVDQDVNLFRGEIAKALGPKYQAASKRFAENEKVLRDVAKYAGVPNQWDKINSKDLKFGEVLLRTLGNASDKPLSMLTDAENLAKTRGGKYGDSILDLTDFADSLEELYGISKTRGFEGGIARGIQQGGPHIEAPASATQAILRTVQAAFKTNNHDKIEALKKALRFVR